MSKEFSTEFRRWLPFLGLNVLISVISVSLVIWALGKRAQPTIIVVTATPAGSVPVSAPINTVAPGVTPQPGEVVPTSAPVAIASPTPNSNGAQSHIIESGDTISSLSIQYDISMEDIIAANPQLPNPDSLDIGQEVFIPSESAADALPTEAPAAPTIAPIATATPAPNAGVVTLAIRAVEGVGDVASERVRITNVGKAEVDLNGWTLESEDGLVYQFPSFRLYDGGGIAIFTTTGQDSITNLYWNQAAAIWKSGKIVTLRDPAGAIHSTFTVP